MQQAPVYESANVISNKCANHSHTHEVPIENTDPLAIENTYEYANNITRLLLIWRNENVVSCSVC